MPFYTCKDCQKDFKHPSLLDRHRKRKTPCFSMEENTLQENPQKPSKTLSFPQFPSISLPVEELGILGDVIFCEYCNEQVSHSKNYKRHLRTKCDKVPENLKNKLLKKYRKNKNHLNSVEDENLKLDKIVNRNNLDNINNLDNLKNNEITNIGRDKISDSTIYNTDCNNNIQNNNTNNTTNNTQNNITTTTNNNLTVNLNSAGKEDISKITYDEKKEIVNSGRYMFKNMMNAVLKFPENQNTYILNKKEKLGAFLNKNNEIEVDRLQYIVKEFVLNYYNMIYDVYIELEEELTDAEKKKHNQEYNNMEPITENKLLEEQAYFKLLSISKKCKSVLETFIKEIE